MTEGATSVQASPGESPSDRPLAYPVTVAARMLGRSARTLKRWHAADPSQVPGRYIGPILMIPSEWVHAYGEWPREVTP